MEWGTRGVVRLIAVLPLRVAELEDAFRPPGLLLVLEALAPAGPRPREQVRAHAVRELREERVPHGARHALQEEQHPRREPLRRAMPTMQHQHKGVTKNI